MTLLNSNKRYCVVGTGISGLASVRFLLSKGYQVELLDTRSNPESRELVESEFESIPLSFGQLEKFAFDAEDILILSPGVALTERFVQRAKDIGASISSDVELFLAECHKPIVAVTGSNGKSTVVSLLAHVLQELGFNALAVGNIGLPVLKAINQNAEIYVLELSSFQLERLSECPVSVACVLNLSEDHMDRYESMAAYSNAKSIIYRGAKVCVFNAGDALTRQGASPPLISFGSISNEANFNYQHIADDIFIFKNDDKLFNVKDMMLKGIHNTENTLACLAILDQLIDQKILSITLADVFSSLQSFHGHAQ